MSTPAPAPRCPAKRSRAAAAPPVSYLAGVTGASLTQARNAMRRARLPVAGTAPLDIAITGKVHGTPWISQISYHQAQALALRLSAACLVVVTYLSGLRPAEVLHLRRAAARHPKTTAPGRCATGCTATTSRASGTPTAPRHPAARPGSGP